MPINRNIEYKPPGATEWQRIEVVVHPNHREVWAMDAASSASERERMRMRQEEAARQALGAMREKLAHLLPIRATSQFRSPPDAVQERFVLGRIKEIFGPSRSFPGEIRSGGSYAESLSERLERLHGRGRPR
jgi:hypothetical protein